MATNTYVALKTTTVGSGVSTFDITSIPSGYTDLILVANAACTATGQYIALRFNSDSGTNYSDTVLEGNGSSATSNRESNLNRVQMVYQRGTDSTFGTIQWHIQNYSNSTTYKTVLGRWNFAGDGVTAGVSTWRNTNAITSITVLTSGTFVSGSSFTVYGVAAEGALAKATGGAIYSDSQYWYHAFGASGTFTPTQSLTADILVVAGGGGGGWTSGGGFHGGGGAGGLLGFSSQSLTATGYTVTVGAGGAVNALGVDSQFGALTLVKGGGYGAKSGTAAATGGSGGGGSEYNTYTAGGSGTSGQGNAGGTGASGSTNGGGGGGGAGAAGSNFGSGGGAGGVGVSTYNSWSQATGIGQSISGIYYLAGGGGGTADAGTPGAGGYGGGGIGSKYNSSTGGNGLPFTGGGGGAGGGNQTGGNGGSGIVIVRYAK